MLEEKNKTGVNDEALNPNEFEETSENQKPADETDGQNEAESNNSEPPKSEEEIEKERRAEFARRRREREANERAERERRDNEERIRRETATQTKLGIITENPWTNKPIKDEKDLEVYEIMRELEASGKDPLSDLPEALAERARQREVETTRANEESRIIKENLAKEISDLRKKYPDVNTKDLAEDPSYLEIAEDKGGRWTITEIYEEWLRQKKPTKPKPNEVQTEVDDNRIEELARNNKQNSSNGNTPNNGGRKKVSDMSREEFDTYWRNKYKS